MADYTQVDATLLAHQALTHPGFVVGTAVSIAGYLSGAVSIFHANIEATANATGVRYLVQLSKSASGNRDWETYDEIVTNILASATEALTATEPIGETVLAVASTTGFSINDRVYVQDTTTLADSEWGRLQNLVTNVSLDLIDGLAVQKDAADIIWGGAEVHSIHIPDLAGYSRIRGVVVHRAATGSDIHFAMMGRFASALE